MLVVELRSEITPSCVTRLHYGKAVEGTLDRSSSVEALNKANHKLIYGIRMLSILAQKSGRTRRPYNHVRSGEWFNVAFWNMYILIRPRSSTVVIIKRGLKKLPSPGRKRSLYLKAEFLQILSMSRYVQETSLISYSSRSSRLHFSKPRNGLGLSRDDGARLWVMKEGTPASTLPPRAELPCCGPRRYPSSTCSLQHKSVSIPTWCIVGMIAISQLSAPSWTRFAGNHEISGALLGMRNIFRGQILLF